MERWKEQKLTVKRFLLLINRSWDPTAPDPCKY